MANIATSDYENAFGTAVDIQHLLSVAVQGCQGTTAWKHFACGLQSIISF
jgi:hypothetical protein